MGLETIRSELMEVAGTELPDFPDSDVLGNIVRLCRDAGTEFHRTLHMVLRTDWLVRNGDGITLSDTSPGIGQAANAEQRRRFNPDPGRLFDLFEENAREWISGAGYDRELFLLLVAEMIGANLFLFPGKSPEVDHFVAQALKNRDLIKTENSPELIESLTSIKERWIRCRNELGERLLALEEMRLRNGQVNRRWLKIFGAEYVRFVEEESRLEICRRKMLLLDLDPDLTAQGLEEKFREMVERERRRLESMHLRASLSLLPEITATGGGPMDHESLKKYRQDSKKLLRDLYLLIHPDVLCQNPAYLNLTENQKNRLKRLWGELMELRDEESRYDSSCLGFYYRSLPILMEKLDLAGTILHNAGIDIDPGFLIGGETIRVQILWLNRAVLSLESAIMTAQAEQKALLEDEETREREIMLTWPEPRQSEIRKGYEMQVEECRTEANTLEETIRDRLTERGK